MSTIRQRRRRMVIEKILYVCEEILGAICFAALIALGLFVMCVGG